MVSVRASAARQGRTLHWGRPARTIRDPHAVDSLLPLKLGRWDQNVFHVFGESFSSTRIARSGFIDRMQLERTSRKLTFDGNGSQPASVGRRPALLESGRRRECVVGRFCPRNPLIAVQSRKRPVFDRRYHGTRDLVAGIGDSSGSINRTWLSGQATARFSSTRPYSGTCHLRNGL
jgi:hypothetical protein